MTEPAFAAALRNASPVWPSEHEQAVVGRRDSEAAFSNAVGMAEIYAKRRQVGLVAEGDVGSVLKIIEGLLPVCGWSG